MAHECMDAYGRIVQWPRNPMDGWHGQLEFEINAMNAAWYVNQLYGPVKRKWKQADGEFLMWLEEETWEERNAVTFSTADWIADLDELET